jgi:hypothetical protein
VTSSGGSSLNENSSCSAWSAASGSAQTAYINGYIAQNPSLNVGSVNPQGAVAEASTQAVGGAISSACNAGTVSTIGQAADDIAQYVQGN